MESDTKNTVEMTEVETWYQQEYEAIRSKADDAKMRAESASDKVAEWGDMEPRRKRRKALSSIRNMLKKPHRLYLSVLEVGDDILRGVDEELKPYRLKRLIDSYAKALGKLNLSLAECRELTESFPALLEEAGGFDWTIEVHPLTTEEGEVTIMTSTGVHQASLG